MNAPLDELYLVWLYAQVEDTRIKSPGRTYWNLFKGLFTTEFIWLVPNDDARIEDGRELRFEFLQDAEIPEVDPKWIAQGVSYLELMVALARRLAFQTDTDVDDCFWILASNIGLNEYNDSYKKIPLEHKIEEVTEQITFRTYRTDGQGGFFPLRHPDRDQTKVEIWYQMCAYILEHD